MSANYSLPKARITVLLHDGVAQTAADAFDATGNRSVERLTTALDAEELKEKLDGVRLLGIRPRTKISDVIVRAAPRLIAVGCFSVGTNQVDLRAACAAGVPVFNAPFSNTRSVAELTIAEIVMLYRGVFPKSVAAHQGRWMKTAQGSHEVRGKTLGIVGYGNIGSQLAMLAEAMGMRVIFHDHTDKLQHGRVLPAGDLKALLAQSDVVSLHLPETDATKNMFGEAEIRAMKPGAFLINNARGSLVDLEALATALRDGRLAGAAVDVFPVEPGSNSDELQTPRRGLDNVILTPHVGGSTYEAQQQIGSEVARKLIDYSDIGSTFGAVNFPQVQLPVTDNVTRFLQVQRNLPGELQRLNEIFARRAVNITGQHYRTDGEVGYVVLDAEGQVPDSEELVEEIRALPGTIRARRLHSA
ncbi:MAG: phosphoglycerate dehydrogenase [Neomegalonema sp.]